MAYFTQTFSKLIETRTFPHARALRTSFLEKLWDSFDVFFGAIVFSKRAGLFDYLTLFIPALIWKLSDWFDENYKEKNLFQKCVYGLLVVMSAFLLFVRLLVCLAAMIPASIITTLVFLVCETLSEKLFPKALSLEGELPDGQRLAIGDYLKQSNKSVENLNISVKLSDKIASNYQLLFWEQEDKGSATHECDGVYCGQKEEYCTVKPLFVVNVDKRDKRQSSNLHALFALNIGGVVKHIEAEGAQSQKRELLRMLG